MFIIILLLIVVAVLGFAFFLYPKLNVQHSARVNGINEDVWLKGQMLVQRCKELKTYYPLQLPTLATANLASAYEYFKSTQSRGVKEEIITEFIAPADYNTLFNVNRKSRAEINNGEEEQEDKNKFSCTAFLLTSRNRLIFARWDFVGASTSSYNIDPRQFTTQAPRHATYTEFYISPNSNNEQEVLGRCNAPFGNVARQIEREVSRQQSGLSESSLEVDEEGRRIL